MTPQQLELLNLESANEWTSEMFLLDIPNYKVKDKNIWVAQYDFRTGTDLRPKDLYCIYGYERRDGKKYNAITHFSQALLDDGHEMYIQDQIDNLFKAEA